MYGPDDEEELLRTFRKDPKISTYMVADRREMSHCHPPAQVNEMKRLDFNVFCVNICGQMNESKFDTDGITNYQKVHFWTRK